MTGIYDVALDWPDATALALGYLRPLLPGVTVAGRVPDPLVVPLVRVQRVGGVRDIAYDRARLLVECWAAGEPAAAALAGTVRDLLRRMRGSVGGWTVAATDEVGGPAHLSDPLTATPRVLLTVETTVRANPAT